MPLCVYCAGTGLSMGHGRGWIPCPLGCEVAEGRPGGHNYGHDPACLSSRVLAYLRRFHPEGKTSHQIAAALGVDHARATRAGATLTTDGRARGSWRGITYFYFAVRDSA